MHETRDTKGFVNRVTSPEWIRYSDCRVQRDTAQVLTSFVSATRSLVVLVIGVGGGGLFGWIWKEPGVTRIGVDLNHAVLTNPLHVNSFHAVEADAFDLPIADRSIDVVVFDFVLHHLVGQGHLSTAIDEGMRVLRPGGHFVAREPSSYSPSGVILNLANRFHLMHALAGASNYEFALSPRTLLKIFREHGTVRAVHGLTYLCSHRLPPRLQDLVAGCKDLARWTPRAEWLADFVLYVVEKA